MDIITDDEITRIIPNFNYEFNKKECKDRVHIPYFNIQNVIKMYKKDYILNDVIASLLTTMILIPQSIAYANIVGLPPKYGIYSSIIPTIVYVLFGTSKELVVGPVAILSILVNNLLSEYNYGLDDYVITVFLMTFFSGFIQLSLAIVKLGSLINFFSHAMIKGVITAASIIISSSQIQSLLGIEKSNDKNVISILYNSVLNYESINYATLIISIVNLSVLIFLKYVKKKKNNKSFPSSLFVIFINIFIFWLFKLDEKYDVEIIGKFSIEPVRFKSLDFSVFRYDLVVKSFLISFISYIECITIAKSVSIDNKYKIDPNQELFTVGLMNILASFFQCFPTTGSFSRTNLSNINKVKSQLSSVLTITLVSIISLFLSDMLYYLPKCLLGCIIIESCINLFDYRTPQYLWKIQKIDFFTWIVSFTTCILFGFQYGVVSGILISILYIINQNTSPHWARLGQLRERGIGCQITYRNLKRYPNAIVPANIEILRFDSYLNFANIEFFKDLVRELCKDENVRNIIIDFSVVSFIDATAIHGINDIIKELRKVNIFFVSLRGPVMDIMRKSGTTNLYEENTNFYNEIHDAVTYIHMNEL